MEERINISDRDRDYMSALFETGKRLLDRRPAGRRSAQKGSRNAGAKYSSRQNEVVGWEKESTREENDRDQDETRPKSVPRLHKTEGARDEQGKEKKIKTDQSLSE